MVLAAFLAGLALSLVAITVAAVRGVRLWRQTKRTTSSLTSELASLEEKTARTEGYLAEWESSTQELDAALARLRASQARLRVLQDALEQAQGRIRWLRVFLPR
jgi:septal ring factor EnvC (AmiA/AmiB activator)